MKDNALQIFQYNGSEMRTVIDRQGETWWVAADVCKVLGHSDTSVAVSRLDSDEKGTRIVCTLRGNQRMLCVNESGLYHLIFTSRKEGAKTFRRWVTFEVLPAIRKTGRYTGDQEQPPMTLYTPPPLPPLPDGYSRPVRETLQALRQSGMPLYPRDLAELLGVPQGAMRMRFFRMKRRGEVKDTGDGYISLI